MNDETPAPAGSPPVDDVVLDVRDLHVTFATDEGEVHAVRGVNFALHRGKVLAIVGESGCGKSVTALAILRLIEAPGRIERGRIMLHPAAQPAIEPDLGMRSPARVSRSQGAAAPGTDTSENRAQPAIESDLGMRAPARVSGTGGRPIPGTYPSAPDVLAAIDLTALSDHAPELYAVRGGMISLVFQEPATALSPVHTIGAQIMETVLLHAAVSESEARRRSTEMLHKVGLADPVRCMEQYPHELSGGMRQRAVIAMALVSRPEVLIADEPTTALDVTRQAQVLGLIKRLQAELGCSVLLITHNMGVVAQMADEVVVMYLGRVVEQGLVDRVLKSPRHPYTIGLMRSIPTMTGERGPLPSVAGSVPSANRVPVGCAFHPRCAWAQAGRCDTGEAPELRRIRRRLVACHRAEEIMVAQEGGSHA